MTAPKVKAAAAVVLGLLLVGVIDTGMSMSATASAPKVARLKLEANPQAARFAPGQPVKLDLKVTNTAEAACGLVDIPEGTLEVVDATRDGKALAPSFVHSLLVDGAGQLLAGHLKPVDPGHSLSVPVDASFSHAIEVMTPLRDGSALTALWPVDAQGKYEFRLRYQVPQLAGQSRCAAASDVVVVKFQVRDSSGPAWLPIAAAGGSLLVLLGLAWFLWRRRRGGSAAKAAVLILAVVCVLTAVGVKPAQANIDVIDPGADADVTKTWSDCLKAVAKFDPSIDNALTGPGKPHVEVRFAPLTERREVPGLPRDSLILWYPFKKFAPELQPGVPYDPCAELYHELIHARDAATDSLTNQYCDDTGVLIDEVKATIAENKWRLAQKPPLPLRTMYEGKRIPPFLLDDCFKGPRQASTGPDSRCRGINGPCKECHDTGDPHLVTLDRAYYDFQTVGEFVALKTVDGEVQVRQAPYYKSRIVSVNTAVAVKAGGKRIGFYLTDSGVAVQLDGVPQTVLVGQTDLGGGLRLLRDDNYSGTHYSVMWPDTMIVTVSQVGNWGLQIDGSVPDGRKVLGLFGDFDGNKANDHPADVYGAFADQWRVSDSTSLFDYASGESTATFTDKSFPDKNTAAPATDGAKQACRLLGIPAGPLFDACVLDVSVTGQAGFAVSVAEVAAPSINSTLLKGDHAFLNVATPGGSAKTTIAATSGQRLYVQVTDTNLPPGCSPLHLLDPQGKELSTGCFSQVTRTGEIEGVLLPSSGDYSVVLTPVGNATGFADMRLYLSTDEKQTLVPDKDFVATIGTPGAVSRLEFNATAGQQVFVDFPSYALPGGCGEVQLLDPANFVVTLACAGAGTGLLDTFTLRTSGTYVLQVDPARDAVGQVRLRMSFITNVTGTVAVGGPEIVTTVTQPGSKAEYTFSGTAGQKVSVDISGSTFPDGCGVFGIVDPKNFVLAFSCTGNGTGTIAPITLPVTGTYVLRADPPDRRVGSAHLRLHE